MIEWLFCLIEPSRRHWSVTPGESLHRFPAPGDGESLTIEVSLWRRYRSATVAEVYGWEFKDTLLKDTSLTFGDKSKKEE